MSAPEHPASMPATERAELTHLVYELLDAHLDTEQLIREPSTQLECLAHLHYLRDLQRTARGILARGGAL